jgi:hypothetical protein
MRNAIVKWWNMLPSCTETTRNISLIHFFVRMQLLHLYLLTTNFCLLQMTVKAHMKLQNCKPCDPENVNSNWSTHCRLIMLIQILSSTWHRSPHPEIQNFSFSKFKRPIFRRNSYVEPMASTQETITATVWAACWLQFTCRWRYLISFETIIKNKKITHTHTHTHTHTGTECCGKENSDYVPYLKNAEMCKCRYLEVKKQSVFKVKCSKTPITHSKLHVPITNI